MLRIEGLKPGGEPLFQARCSLVDTRDDGDRPLRMKGVTRVHEAQRAGRRDLAMANGLGEPAIRPPACFGSVALNSRTCSRVRPVAVTRAAFSAISEEMKTNLPGATRIRFMPPILIAAETRADAGCA